MTHHIHQEVTLPAKPTDIYRILTDAEQFSRLTGAPAEIDRDEGGAFSCFGGMIYGRNLECLPGERLVQAWRAKTWEPGVFSTVRFELKPEGSSTRVVLDHTGYPDGQDAHLAPGWYANYWDPLRALLSATS